MQKESSIKDIINNALQQVRAIIDADTVVGRQIITPSGTVIIPISKISMGFASGGIDLPSDENDSVKNFGGGGGTGVTVHPIGFLTVYADGKVEMLPLAGQEKPGTVEQVSDLLNNAPAIIAKLMSMFNLKDSSAEAEEEANAEELAELEEEYDLKLDEELNEIENDLSEKELKKLRKAEAKAAKKAAKAN